VLNLDVTSQLWISVVALLLAAFSAAFTVYSYYNNKREKRIQMFGALCAELEMNARLGHVNVLTFRYRLGLMVQEPKSIFLSAPTQFSSSAWNAAKASGLLMPEIFRAISDTYGLMEKINALIQLRLSRTYASDVTLEEMQVLDTQIAEQTDKLVPIIKRAREELREHCGSLPSYWSLIGPQLQESSHNSRV